MNTKTAPEIFFEADATPDINVGELTDYEQSNETMNPLTGALVDLDDIDSIILAIDGTDGTKRQLNDLKTFDRMLRERAVALTEGDAKTRRLRGKEHQAKVVMGDRYWDQSVLKEAWNSFPKFADKYLRIGSINPQLRECNKLASMTSDDPAFDTFKGMLLRAKENGSDGLATVSIEK